jgi:hypothetical protein
VVRLGTTVPRAVGGLLTGLVTVVLLGAVFASPASADYGPGYFSTNLYGQAAIFTDPGSYLGGGTEQEWTPAFAGLSGYPNNLAVDTTSRSEDSWEIDFEAPTGQTLHAGVYDDAGESPSATTPALTATEGGAECGTTGRFEIKDLAYDSSGVPTRFWVLFELNCGSGALFGEFRFGEPVDDATLQSTPSIVRWPADNFWTVGTPVPVLFTASQASTVSSVALTGTDASDFRVTRDGCTGLELAAGASCSVWVDFDPLAAGTRTASLTVTDASGATHSVPLQGFTYGGTTRFVAISDPGDQLAQGHSYSFGGPADDIWVTGSPTLVRFAASDGTDSFQGEFASPKGQTLSTGSSWTSGTDYPNGRDAGVSIDYDEWGCDTTGQFQVVSATYDSNGELTSVDITYQQRCDDSTGLLHGELQWRAGDDVAPAPWMEPDATGAQDSSGDGGTTGSGTSNGGGSAGASSGIGTSSSSSAPTTLGTAQTSAIGPGDAATGPTLETRSSQTASGDRLKRVTATLSRDSRRAANTIRGARSRATGSSLGLALRSIVALQAAVRTAQQRLHGLTGVPSASVRRALRQLATWQTTLTAERRVLSSSHEHIPLSLLQLVARANDEATAAVRTMANLDRS